MSERWSRSALILLLIMAVGGCGSSDDGGGGGGTQVTDFVETAGVIDLGAAGTLRSGSPPAPSGGPILAVTDAVMVINGGTAEVQVSASAPFTTIFASVEDGPVNGFFAIDLGSAVQGAAVQLTLQQELPSDQFSFVFSVADAAGNVGPEAATAVDAITNVGTGDVQVSVSWDQPTDVDLHVVDPSGEEIFFQNLQSASGGMLDLDSNPGCAIDGINNENITWPTDQAPRGTYIVRVDYFDSCGATETNFIVTVQRSGSSSQTFRGTFTGPGDRGTAGSGVEVTRFTF